MRLVLKTLLALVALAGLGLGAWKGWALHEAHRVRRVIFLSPVAGGLDTGHAFGLQRLLIDQMEIASAATVLAPEKPPSESELPALDPKDLLMRLSARRDGNGLSLRLEWVSVEARRQGQGWDHLDAAGAVPAEVFRQTLSRGPLPRIHPGAEHFLPEDPARFWELAAAESVQEDVVAGADLDLSNRLAQSEPGSAAAWLNLGEHIYRQLWTVPAGAVLPQQQALAAFDTALRLVPGYPRAALLEGMLFTDLGNQRAALRTLAEARAMRPHMPDLYGGLAYAGRTSGLLEGASRAAAERTALSRPFGFSNAWFAENTYLYAGQWDTFRDSLSRRPDPVFLFYRAYLELAAGRNAEALALFKQGAGVRDTSVPFSDLCFVYASALEGHPDEALSGLRTFEAERGRLRIPDGELTFKVAEAYAFLGHPDDAIAAAGRAFAQGFGCLAWYERSPLFAEARKNPRWPTLREHIKERQAIFEDNFPPRIFG